MKRSTWIVGAIVIIGIALLAWGGAQNAVGTTASADDDAAGILAVRADDWTAGTTTPQAVLVEYSDYQCPACRQYAGIVTEIVAEFDDRLQFVYRHFPLSQKHFNARMAAQAAEAAGMQGAYFQMSDLLFEKQQEWQGLPREQMIARMGEYAVMLGLDVPRFSGDIESEAVAASISADVADAARLGLNSTPTFFLNGEKITNPRSHDDFRLLVKMGISTIKSQ